MPNRRLAAIVSLDVVGYSARMDADASGTLTALNNVFRTIVKPVTAEHGGRVVKLLGDGALIEHGSALNACLSAAEIQKNIANWNEARDRADQITFRAGIHAGDIVVESDDVFGSAVNIASRLQGLCRPGEVALSRAVADLAGDRLPYAVQAEGTRDLKNISRPIEVLSIRMTDPRHEKAQVTLQSPEVRFCKAKDGMMLAWTTSGNGRKLVKAQNWISHVELDWRNPASAHMLKSLSQDFEVVRFDARGNGLSDWDVPEISFETFAADLLAVFDVANIERAPIFALSQGCAVAAAFAAAYPDRVSCIVMIGGFAQGREKRKSTKDAERTKALQAMLKASWDDGAPSVRDLMADVIVPQASTEAKRQFAADMLEMISAENMARYRAVLDQIDVTDILPELKCPCLVVHGRDERMHPLAQSRLMASLIPNSRFLPLDTNNHVVTANDPTWPLLEREIRAFLKENQAG